MSQTSARRDARPRSRAATSTRPIRPKRPYVGRFRSRSKQAVDLERAGALVICRRRPVATPKVVKATCGMANRRGGPPMPARNSASTSGDGGS